MTWISTYIHCFHGMYSLIQPQLKPPFKLGCGWGNTSHSSMRMWLLTHDLIPISVYLISWSLGQYPARAKQRWIICVKSQKQNQSLAKPCTYTLVIANQAMYATSGQISLPHERNSIFILHWYDKLLIHVCPHSAHSFMAALDKLF